MSRKQYRTGEDGERIALASACIVCQKPEVYGLDRCHAHYMAEYRRRRAASVQVSTADADKASNLERPTKPLTESAKPQSPKGVDTSKPWQRAETFETENFAIYWLQ